MRTVGGAVEREKQERTKRVSIQVTSQRTATQQMAYRLTSQLTKHEHCCHICNSRSVLMPVWIYSAFILCF